MAEDEARLLERRYERKFVTREMDRDGVETLIRLNPALFREIYHERVVNNIYLDCISLSNYWANVAGLSRRLKCRIRWYGEMLGRIERPVLELKGKTGLLGTKESYVLPPFVLGEHLGLGEIWEKAEIPASLRHYVEGLEPTLLNTYRRRYYLSADGNYRITVDSGLGFYRIRRHDNSFLERRRDDRTIIIELKFGYGLEPGAARISNRFPFRLSRSSKYVRGIEELAA